jgi:hypothetical protein
MPKDASPQEVEDRLVTRHGLTREAARSVVNRVEGDPANDANAREISRKIGEKADQELKAAQGPNDPKVSQAWIDGKVDAIRTKVVEIFDHSINNIPKGLNKPGMGMLKQFYNWKQFLNLGKTESGGPAMVGAMADAALHNKTTALWEEYQAPGGKMPKDDFREAVLVQTAAFESRSDIKTFVKDMRDLMAENPQPIHKQTERILQLGETLGNESLVNKFIKENSQVISVAGDELLKAKIIKEKKIGFLTNQIALESEGGDLFDKLIYGKEISKSILSKKKVYNNYIEAMIDGHIPASMKYDDVIGNYLSRAGKSLRVAKLASEMKANAALPDSHDDKVRVTISSDESMPGIAVRDPKNENWEVPEAPGNKKFQNLGGLNYRLEGIYAHPEIYRGLTHVFESGFEKQGLVKAMFRLSSVWKSMALSFSFFHEGSLRQKAISLSQSHGLGVAGQVLIDLKNDSLTNEGLSTLAGNVDTPILLDLVRNDFSLHQHDMSKNPLLASNYNFKTGEKTITAKASDIFNAATNFFHDRVFEKVQPGLKIAMGIRLVKSDWFQNLKGKEGEPLSYDDKLQTVSKIMNDTFGGQNLEAIGRTRLAQTLLQAVFLAPDWQEAKMKRMFGTVLAQDPNARSSFRAAVAAEFAMMLVLKIAAQQLYSGITGDQRSLKDMAEDIWNGRLGSVYIGKTKENKPRDKFMTFGGSANQDLRVPLTFAKGLVGTVKGDFRALPQAIGEETSHKFSPLFSLMKSYTEHKTEMQKKLESRKPPSGYDYNFLPMSVAQTIAALTGGLGEDRANEAIQSQISSTLGVPIQVVTSLQTARKAKEKQEKEEKNAKRKLQLMK